MLEFVLSGRSIIYIMQLTQVDDLIIRDYYLSDVEVRSVVIFTGKYEPNKL